MMSEGDATTSSSAPALATLEIRVRVCGMRGEKVKEIGLAARGEHMWRQQQQLQYPDNERGNYHDDETMGPWMSIPFCIPLPAGPYFPECAFFRDPRISAEHTSKLNHSRARLICSGIRRNPEFQREGPLTWYFVPLVTNIH